MPETGNNINGYKKILSIRLWRGGLSFYIQGNARQPAVSLSRAVSCDNEFASSLDDALAEAGVKSGGAHYDVVQVFIDTSDTIYIPAELVDRADMEELLEAAGISVSHNSAIVVADSVCGVGAVSVFPREFIEALQDRFRGLLRFFSPLHEILLAASLSDKIKDTLIIYPTACSVYIVQYDKACDLILAETYPVSGEADVIYYCTELTAADKTGKVRIMLYGERAPRYLSAVKKFFVKTSILRPKI